MAGPIREASSMRPDKLDRNYPTRAITLRAYLTTKGLWATITNPVVPTEERAPTAHAE